MFLRMRSPSKSSMVAAIALFLLLSLHLHIAFSASGGRMGGGSFSTKSRSSSVKSRSSSISSCNYHRHHSTGFIHDPYSAGRRCSSSKTEVSSVSFPGVVVSIILVVVVGFSILVFAYHQYLEHRVSLLIVQVGLSGKADTVQRDLNEMSNTTNTSSLKGWHHILTETVLVLLKHSDSFISGHANVKRLMIGESAEKSFKELVSDERVKFDTETLVNVNNVNIRRPFIPQSTKPLKDYIVVTVLIAAKGSYELPTIRSIDDMKAALKSLNISASKLMAVEVLWTPQDENDTLSEEELLENYPLLDPFEFLMS